MMSIRSKILIVVSAAIGLTTLTFAVVAHIYQRDAFLNGVDWVLKSAAYAFNEMVPPSYHDRINGPGSIDQKTYRHYMDKLSQYADEAGIIYLYSYVFNNGSFYVAATNATPEERRTHTETPFYDKYTDPPPGMLKAWRENRIVYDEYKDKWGCFRSIFVPAKTPKGRRYIVGADVTLDFITSRLNHMLIIHISLGAFIFMVAWLITYFLLRHILGPIRLLARETEELAKNDFCLPRSSQQEIKALSLNATGEIRLFANAFLQMNEKLSRYLQDLERTTAEKQRVESELSIAHKIQMSFLPVSPLEGLAAKNLDLATRLIPAREVGGDLYDYFLLDEKRLFLAVGDVSDKGVPSALFMAVGKSIMKEVARLHKDPASILMALNNRLAANNESMMFITAFCGILDVTTGHLVYASAGHNPPVFIENSGKNHLIEVAKTLPLGIFPETQYTNQEISLAPGQGLLIYTDGAVEARATNGEFFGLERFQQSIEILWPSGNAEDLINGLIHRIEGFAEGAPQHDDMTFLALGIRKREV